MGERSERRYLLANRIRRLERRLRIEGRASVVAFVVLAGALGTPYALTMPPLQVADEKTHLFRAFGVSLGRCVATRWTSVPNSLLRLNATFPPVLEKRRLVTHADVARWSAVPLRAEVASMVTATAANVYGCAPYLAAAAGIRAATALDQSPSRVMYAGRLANLAAYVGLVALALALLPDGRVLLLALALMPMTLHQAASLSADALTIASAFLATAVALRAGVHGGRDARAHRTGLALSATLAGAALCKTNVALVPLAALVPTARTGLRRFRLIAAVVAPAVGAALLWSWVNRENLELFRAAQAPRGVDMVANARAALFHPVAFAASVARTTTAQAASLAEQLIGVLGWATVRLPPWVKWLYGGVLLAAPFLGTRSLFLRATQRAALAATATLGFVSVFWGVWTIAPDLASTGYPSHGVELGGLAGRYFIPFALPALLAVSFPTGDRSVRAFGVAVVGVSLLTNAVALHEIRGHYFTSGRWVIDTAMYHRGVPRVVELTPGMVVEQSFRPRFNGLGRIDVDVATYGRHLPGRHAARTPALRRRPGARR